MDNDLVDSRRQMLQKLGVNIFVEFPLFPVHHLQLKWLSFMHLPKFIGDMYIS